uniref:Uncharacterized protein n=1 Tax=Romanomermis culicivorax TaxID=13658 RepID=A0A915KR27_ROMCU
MPPIPIPPAPPMGIFSSLGNSLVAVSRNSSNLSDFFRRRHRLGHLFESIDDSFDGRHYTTSNFNWIGPFAYRIEALPSDSMSEYGRARGPVASFLVGFVGNILEDNSTALATVTPSFVIFGPPQLCSMITLRP